MTDGPKEGQLCAKGHPLLPDNFWVDRDVRRGEARVRYRCLKCRRAYQKKQYARAQEERNRSRAREQRAIKDALAHAKRDTRGRSTGREASVEAGIGAYAALTKADQDRGKALPPGVIKQRVDDLIRLTDAALTAEKIALAGPKDLVVMLGVLIDKRQVLRGEATQRVDVNVRVQLDQVGSLLVEELKRRKLPVVDVEAEEINE